MGEYTELETALAGLSLALLLLLAPSLLLDCRRLSTALSPVPAVLNPAPGLAAAPGESAP